MEKSEKELFKEIEDLISTNDLKLIKEKYNILLNEIKILDGIKTEIELMMVKNEEEDLSVNNIKALENKANVLEEIWKKLYYKRSFIAIIEKRIYHFFYGAKVRYKNKINSEVLKVYKLCEHANKFCTCADFNYLTNKITVKNAAGIELAIDKSLLERAE